MKLFYKEAIATIKTSGTVKPSSKYLINDCLKDIAFTDAKTIIEFGSGDGCFTQELAARMNNDSKLFSFEINPKFYDYCYNKFISYMNVNVLNCSALEFDKLLKTTSINQVDCIVSTLPLTLFKDSQVKELLDKSYKYLKNGGLFIQYQYSLGKYKQLKETYDKVNIDLTIRNLPPAFIYKCFKN